VVQLLGMGADVHRQNEDGELSVYRATAEGHAEVRTRNRVAIPNGRYQDRGMFIFVDLGMGA
jgi:hypothetical protein